MTSEKKNEIGADDSNGRVRKVRKAAALASKESDQLRLAHRCVLHIRGVGRIAVPDSIFFARENRCPSQTHSDKKNHRQVNISYTNYMKSPLCSFLLKAALVIVPLALCFGSSTYGQARNRNVLSPGPVRPGNLDYRTELPRGYLNVYLSTDGINDRDAWYFPRASFTIYTIDGRLFKDVKSQRFADDQIPEVVALPVGTYTVVARSKRDGYVRILVVIKEGQQTTVDLDLWEKKTKRLAHN